MARTEVEALEPKAEKEALAEGDAALLEPPHHLTLMLWLLLTMFILGTLCLMAFNLVFQTIGADLGVPEQASLITAIPGIVLGIVCFIYGSLGDFVSLRTMCAVGVVLLLGGSLLGFFAGPASLWLVILARSIQTAGAQVAGSVYLVLTARYLHGARKVTYFGIFTAGYQLSSAIGVVAGGYLTQLNWSLLFLIPVISVLCVPTLLANLPRAATGHVRVDVAGFIIFGVATGLLTLFFTYYAVWMLVAALVVYALFAVYIHKAAAPFITPAFFHNTRWLASISLFLIMYFVNYAIAPTYNALGTQVYGLSTGSVSLMLVAGYLVGCCVAVLSGRVDARLGRRATIILACLLVAAGFFAAAFMVDAGVVALAITACLVYGGMGLIYSPVVDTVVSTVAPGEAGRAIGMNDLVLNVSGSIGIAIFAPLMAAATEESVNYLGITGAASSFSTLFSIYGIIALATLVVYLLIKNYVAAQ
jgi:DHA2 family metal-tetracycline-proton antiporter-like MFS transporter